MLNVLIITYYFPPCNGVQGWRPFSWYKHFPKKNIHTTVLTRRWLGNETIWEDSIREYPAEMTVEENENSRLICLPYRYSFLKKLAELPLFKIKIISKLFYLILKLTGNFSLEVDARRAFQKYASSYIKKNKVDLLIISAPPDNLIRLGYKLSKKHNLPFIMDFRDLWDNDELKANYNPSFNKKVHNVISKFYIKRWLKNVTFITTVSKPLAEKIQQLTNKKVVEITNGFEKELFSDTHIIQPSSEQFTISIIGSIHDKQDIDIILNGLNRFLSITGHNNVLLNFIGIKAINSVATQIKNALPKECIFISDRLPRETAIEYTLRSHVLLYAGWKDYQGIYSGKIFDYIGSHRNILIAPGDNSVIDNIVLSTYAGKIANSVEEFSSYLLSWFEEWKQTGKLSYHGSEREIDNYTREKQAINFAELILARFNPTQPVSKG